MSELEDYLASLEDYEDDPVETDTETDTEKARRFFNQKDAIVATVKENDRTAAGLEAARAKERKVPEIETRLAAYEQVKRQPWRIRERRTYAPRRRGQPYTRWLLGRSKSCP